MAKTTGLKLPEAAPTEKASTPPTPQPKDSWFEETWHQLKRGWSEEGANKIHVFSALTAWGITWDRVPTKIQTKLLSLATKLIEDRAFAKKIAAFHRLSGCGDPLHAARLVCCHALLAAIHDFTGVK